MPLDLGSCGDSVRDLHRRLVLSGFDPGHHDPGLFSSATKEALVAFQQHRGIPATGVCDHLTWSSLIEAGFELGDRTLYLRSPMFRGDDVAELQRLLGALGFDAGRVDGILGSATDRALRDFQRNCAVSDDGICGLETMVALRRLTSRLPTQESVAEVREREAILHSRRLASARMVIGHVGPLPAAARAVARRIRRSGAVAIVLEDPDWSAQARAANTFGADIYLGFEVGTPSISYFATEGYESPGGRHLAELIHQSLGSDGIVIPTPSGMRIPVLRETRMPAVLWTFNSPRDLGPESLDGVFRALELWFDGHSTLK